ncbi:MAG: hypothetical protein AB7F89_15380 [Pirellulaceae bacterium]
MPCLFDGIVTPTTASLYLSQHQQVHAGREQYYLHRQLGVTLTAEEILHEVQLTTYSRLFRPIAGQQEADMEIGSLVKTKRPKLETDRHPPRMEQQVLRLLRVYLDDLDAGQFCYRPGFHRLPGTS